MSKIYLTVFSLAWQNEFVYRLNFILWRIRNLMRFFLTFFLWEGVFTTSKQMFGYSKSEMLTYVFTVILVSALVQSAPSADNIGGEIGNGDLSNYLVKPLSYLKYWFSRDLASKSLNLVFAMVEFSLLAIILHPVFAIPTKILTIAAFLITISLAVVLYFFISTCSRFISFWAPENTWGVSFIIVIFIETLAGSIFPLDVLPENLKNLIMLTPFPYLLYFPTAIFLGKISSTQLPKILFIALTWVIIMFFFMRYLWGKGLKNYSSEGR